MGWPPFRWEDEMDEKTRSVKIWSALWIGWAVGTATQFVCFVLLPHISIPLPWGIVMALPTISLFAWLSDKMARDRGTS